MSSLFDTNFSFPRSYSSSDIVKLQGAERERPVRPLSDELPRSASFSNIPTNDTSQYEPEDTLHRVASASAVPLSPRADHNRDLEGEQRSDGAVGDEPPNIERLGRRKSLVARPKSWIRRGKASPEKRKQPIRTATDAPPVPLVLDAPRDKSKGMTGSFATFARKSWMNSSRSPSPSKEKPEEQTGESEEGLKIAKKRHSSSSPRRSMARFEEPLSTPTDENAPRKPSTLQKLKRPQSVLMSFTNFNSANSSTSSLPRSSMDNRSTPRTSTDRVPPMPPAEKLQTFLAEKPRKRDELGSAFRSLENDLAKFQSKSWSLKTNVVRASLLPFLKAHASHPSDNDLRSEDLEKRVKILDRWWVGLLEVLDGRQNQTVSGVDRPVLLEAVVAIMTRPEWRMGPSISMLLSNVTSDVPPEHSTLQGEHPSDDLSCSNSKPLSETVYHNIRTLFVQNLLSQMNFVVDKMSLRHAPASLVTFCGKAAAYAFFFVPGVADMLVRIWKLQGDILRRTADEFGVIKRIAKADDDEAITGFPAYMHSLRWSSAKTMVKELRQVPNLPNVASKIPWYGPWIARWCGRDSDLFFVFVKHYHILFEDFVPKALTLATKARSPGFALVQAQVLTVIDATIHRQPAADVPLGTFDDVLAGADANAATLPLPSTNSTRLMAENRLIMLLRDFLSDRSADVPAARLTFVESFTKLMQASARKTSLFNNNACFTLCDFLEEAVAILVRFALVNEMKSDYIEWQWWMNVCKKMLKSQNTTSEIRLFAFIYSSWHTLTHDERRKEVLCLDWLLTEEVFGQYFNHWCPMVRAYYMRLLCWRICRDDGEATELDTKIFLAASTRLKATWAKYLFLKQVADRDDILPPSIIPCHPAPGRRLMISRNDTQSPVSNLYLGFDGVLSSKLPSAPAPEPAAPTSNKNSTLKIDTSISSHPKLSLDQPMTPSTKKRWTFMNKMLPASFGNSASSTQEPSSPTTQTSNPSKQLEDARRENAIARSRPPLHLSTSSDSDTPPSTSTSYRAYAFKFTLEWAQHFEKAPPPSSHPQSQNQPNSLSNRRSRGNSMLSERRLSPPRLPASAHAWLGYKVPGVNMEVKAKDPAQDSNKQRAAETLARAKYAGRALAEWASIVLECNNFVERRLAEGVPCLRLVEVPVLGVEGFKKVG